MSLYRKFPEIADAALDWCIQPQLAYCAPSLPSADLASLLAPIAACCQPRRVSLCMANGDLSDFTRESFSGI